MNSLRFVVMAGFILTMILSIPSTYAQDHTSLPGSFSGTVYSDYYWVAQNHDESIVNENGVWFRRIYFTYNRDIASGFSTRLRLEMDSDGSFSDQAMKMTPVVKDAYLKWKKEEHEIVAGISGTPTWGMIEDVWSYRSVEKSPLDLFGMGSSRDLGLSFKGSLLPEGPLNYHFMLGNGNSNRANEINKGKKWMLSLGYELSEDLLVEIYGDYDDRIGSNDRYTLQLFGAYEAETFSLGALFARQTRQNEMPAGDLDVQLASVFSHFDIAGKTRGFLRIDHAFDGIPGTDDNDYLPISSAASSTFFTSGIDYIMAEDIHLQPNVEMVIYGEDVNGITPDTDIIPRITLAYRF